MAQVAEHLSWQAGPIAELSLVLGPTQTNKFLVHLINRSEEYTQNPKRYTKH